MTTTPSNPDTVSPGEPIVIPWERRREIGRWKAYWRTVAMVLRNGV